MRKRKPIEMIKNKNAPLIKMEDELSTLVQFQENIMAQIIDRQDEEYANFLINQITAFMEENNISTCFVLNKEEFIDCLNEHNKLHYEILNLQSQLDQANERLKSAIVPRYRIGTKLYMIPTEFNRLKGIKDYELLSISLSSIGLRYDLSLNKKEKGVEPFYCASEDMFGQSIFATLEEAEKKLQELRGGE